MSRQLVTSLDIESFFVSTRRDAQELLPLVVRRLIIATTVPGAVAYMTMPAGDDLRLHGWDGKVLLQGLHQYVPEGTSAWEMGTGYDPEIKAQSDFDKRSADPKGMDPASSTFVFVTPKVWAGKEKWARDRLATGLWRDVRVIDAQLLAEWFDSAPAVAAWFHAEREQPVDDLDDIDSVWRKLHALHGVHLTPRLVVGGRESEAEQLRSWIANPTHQLLVTAESPDEVVAFVTAALSSTPEIREQLSPRVLVARERTALHYLGALHSPHVVVISDPSLYVEFRSARLRQVSLIVPGHANRGHAEPDQMASLRLPLLRREATEAALQGSLTLTAQDIRRIAQESRGSLQALLWSIASPGVRRLPWLQEPDASELSALVLARQWSVASHSDQTAVARIAGRPYADVRATASKWQSPAGPIQIWGESWDWKAWRFAWEQLAPGFAADLVERFFETCVEVLGTPDPALELPAEERWMAGALAKAHPYSIALRSGLVSSIAMFGVLGDRNPGIDGQGVASGLTRRLLGHNDLATAWLSLGRWLPEFAEAAPDVFLELAERVAADETAIAQLFVEGGLFGTAPHVPVLWALERLAWSSEYLPRVVVLLGRLAAADPGGSLANRPQNSLREILLPWHPGTSASLDHRLNAFRHLSKRWPDIAWECGLSLLPSDHDVSSPTDEPQYRRWHEGMPTRRPAAERREFVGVLTDILSSMVGDSSQRWCDLAKRLPQIIRYMPERSAAVLDRLEAHDVGTWQIEERVRVWNEVRELINHHAAFPEAAWSLDGEELNGLRRLADRLMPTTARQRHAWLFGPDPELGVVHPVSWEDEKRAIGEARQKAVEEVISEDGLKAAVAWADEVDVPEFLGATLARRGLSAKEEADVIEGSILLAEDACARRALGRGFVGARESGLGRTWALQWIDRLCQTHSAAAAAQFAVALEPHKELWDHLAGTEASLVEEYWRSVGIRFANLEEAEFVVPKLISAGRNFSAVCVAARGVKSARAKQDELEDRDRRLRLALLALADVPKHLPESEPGAPRLSWATQCLADLLEFVEAYGQQSVELRHVLAQWEWQWLPALERSTRGLRALPWELSRSPEFFMHVLSLVFRGEDEPPRAEDEAGAQGPDSEDRRRRFHQAWRLLESWRVVPGLQYEGAEFKSRRSASNAQSPTVPFVVGNVEQAALQDWVGEARELAKQARRIKVCDSYIGRVFAFAPSDHDGKWPCEPVRECIEEVASHELESGLRIAMLNRRGVHYQGKTGDAERRLRDGYLEMAKAIDSTHMRTSSVLRAVAREYDGMARQQDEIGKRDEIAG